jgi:hypothetical protein
MLPVIHHQLQYVNAYEKKELLMKSYSMANGKEMILETHINGKLVFQKYSSFPGTFIFTKKLELAPTRALIGRKGATQLDATSVYLFEIPFQYLPLFWVLITVIICTFIVSFFNFLLRIIAITRNRTPRAKQN